MNTTTFKTRQFIERPLQEVFQFFERPENLAKITPPNLKFQILSNSPVTMAKGIEIKYRVCPLFFPMIWVSRIEEFSPPHMFVDVQIKGPYESWHHTHTFIEEEGGTWIHDEVRYTLPLGLLGRMANWLFVRRQLNQIFSYRAMIIRNVFR